LQLPPEPLTRGYRPPDARSLCPLSSTEFVEPSPPPTKFLGTPLALVDVRDTYKILMGNLEGMRKVDIPTYVSENNETNLKRVSYKDVKVDSYGSGQDVSTFGILFETE